MEVGDIASKEVDAVVRPATASLTPIEAPESVPHRLFAVRQPLDVGAAVVTDGAGVAAEFVIHAVIRSVTHSITTDGIRLALSSALHQSRAWHLERLAIPLVGSGPDGISSEDAASLLAEVLSAEGRTAAGPREVCIVVGSEDERSLMEAHLRRWLAHES